MTDTASLALAVQAFKARDRDLAANHLAAVLRVRPYLGETWGAVSRLASTIGEINLSLAAAREHVRHAPSDTLRRLNYTATLARLGRVEQALTEASELVREHPRDPRVIHLHGTLLAQMGQTDAALAELQRALAAQTSGEMSAWTWLTIVDLKRISADDGVVGALERLRSQPALSPEAKSAVCYALGKAFDDLGEYDRAFTAYAEGAGIMARDSRYDAAAETAFADRCIEGFSPDMLARLTSSAVDSSRPIFVLGPPRSGTTLVEQMLVSHSTVSAGAELNLFTVASMSLGGYAPTDLLRFEQDRAGRDPWSQIGRSYLHLLDERFGAEGRVVDKTLNHGRILGLIQHVLPEARFVWMTRDVGDVAWSCFRTRFASNIDWTLSLDSIGHYLREEDRLRHHWAGALPEKVLVVPYEALVREPDEWIPKILDHVGLAPEPRIKAFHETHRPVQTASVAQVRRPLYQSSIGGWRRYAERLSPVFEAFEAANQNILR